MLNPIKYTTGSEALALKSGNFYISTNDVGKGPTSTTGYYNGVDIPSGGYVIYMYNSDLPGNLSYHSSPGDDDLISFTNNLAGESFTTAEECLVYYAGQSNMMCFNRDYEGIVTDSLVFNLDAGFTPSYPTSGSTWFDLSGNDNDGTLINGVGYDSSNGGSLTFDGTDDYVEVSYDADSFNIGTGDFSFNIWYYPDNNVSYRRLFSIGLFRAAGNFAFERQNGSNVVVHINGTFNVVGSSNSSGLWYNYTVTRESGLVKVYKNGAYVTQFTKTDAITNTNNILIAKESSIYFDGKIPIIHFYKKALSASEVLYNHNTLKGRFGL